MQFKDYLATFPTIDHLSGLDVINSGEVMQHIPAIEGKLGSLKLYYALYEKFDGKLDTTAAKQGLEWFAEHTEDAKENVGKHPNIDLLFKVINNDLSLVLQPIHQ
ncbi:MULTISPECIES: DUF2322 family protein [unclassified Mannheimia]|uniref:DUF2322 family protein n=1 Tax=unclassified Mannheimia TaxID=2645054 RepID=UPI00359EEA64